MKKRFLSLLLMLCMLLSLLPTTVLAESGGVTLEEKTVTVSTWDELKQAVQKLEKDEFLNATITQSLEASSQLLIGGRTVVLTTNADNIIIKRTLTAKTSNIDSRIAPMFYLQNGASLTINGGEKGIELTANDVFGGGKKSNSLILAQSGTTLSLSNVSFADFTFGYSQNTSSFGAIRTFNATVTLNDVSMTNCTAANGVLICANNSKVNMNRCVVTNTKYWGNENNNGGVVWVRGADSDVTIDGCEIKNCGSAEPNEIANSGGPIWLTGGNLPTGQITGGTTRILNSTISGNTAMRGAGILAMNTNLILSNVNITDNTCFGDSDNKVWWQGAGLYIHTCSVSMTNVKITGNKGAFLGGGVFIQGPADTKGNAVPEVTMDADTEISGNSAVCGGGIYVGQGLSIVRLNGTKIKDNTAVKNTNYEDDYPEYNGNGGGIANDYETVVLNNAEISGNTADAHGGGIMNWGKTTITGGSVTGNQAGLNDEDGCGGGICIADWKVHIEGDTAIFSNTADCGNGVYVGGGTTFEIQDSVAIDKGNDVGLGGAYSDPTEGIDIPSAYITVSATFTGATKESPISISSQDTNIEDLKVDPPTDGTPLVLYTEEAGGVEAAKAADLAKIFVPSQYMQEELLIGQSQKADNGQYLTYVKERSVPDPDPNPDADWSSLIPAIVIAASQNTTPLKLNTAEHMAYVNGYPDGTVKPNGNITRAEVAAILYRIMDAKCVSAYSSTTSGFRDVDSGKWYNTYVATLNNAGVITDSANGYFRPDDAITRAELAAMLGQFVQNRRAANYFSDVSADHWAAIDIAVCANMGWITGYPDGTFRPDATITRAEMMAMVNRALERTPESKDDLLPGMKTWSDNANTGAWYYLDVQEATNSHTYTKSGSHESWKTLI